MLFNCIRTTKTETEVSFLVSGCSNFKRGGDGSLWDTPYICTGVRDTHNVTVGGQHLRIFTRKIIVLLRTNDEISI